MKPFHRVIMCGARDWSNAGPILRELRRLKKEHGNKLIIIEGEAPGADQMARVLAHQLDIHVAGVWALWETRHRGAGPQRNTAMAALQPDEVIAFHADITKSRGTADMVKQARALLQSDRVRVVRK